MFDIAPSAAINVSKTMENICFKCGSDCEKPGSHWFVKNHKLYFCAYCSEVLNDNAKNDDLLANFMTRKWFERLDVGEEIKNIIEARIMRNPY